ncbi:MAG: pyrroline-5-carboxylate reductase [Intestinimonas sp.]|jgi:pyrroline-5-carboxylate reductase|nr:pyrroline-5-carboxylate reductase [Intestinimonas sp.]
MASLKLGFIGAGNMASAILNGVLDCGAAAPEQIWISNRHEEKLVPFRLRGVHVTLDNAEVARSADIVVLAVKPQMFSDVIKEIADLTEGKCVVSIAAGISVSWLKARLPGTLLVRAMPNTPLLVGRGATAVAAAPEVPPVLFQTVLDLFSAAGVVEVIDETQMDDILNVNGSTPAFFFRMADVMMQQALAAGIAPHVAASLIAQTMEGSAQMLKQSGKTPEELTRQVCSPGGTTMAALSAFEDLGFDAMMREAMNRCVRRSRELGQ